MIKTRTRDKRGLYVLLDNALYDKVDLIAFNEDITKIDLIRHALDLYFKEYERKHPAATRTIRGMDGYR